MTFKMAYNESISNKECEYSVYNLCWNLFTVTCTLVKGRDNPASKSVPLLYFFRNADLLLKLKSYFKGAGKSKLKENKMGSLFIDIIESVENLKKRVVFNKDGYKLSLGNDEYEGDDTLEGTPGKMFNISVSK